MPGDLQWFREEVYTFCQEHVVPISHQIDEDDVIPREIWKSMGDAGLLGITIPEKYGGRELGYLAHVIAIEEISRASGSVGFSYTDHSNICLTPLGR